MSITYRLVKGSALTHAELDNNFSELDAARALQASQIAANQSATNANGASIAALNQSQADQNAQIAQLTASLAALSGVPVVSSIVIEPSSNIGESTPVTYTAVYTSTQPILEYAWTFYTPAGVFLGSAAIATPAIAGAGTVYVRLRNAAGWSVQIGRSVPIGSTIPVVTDITHDAPASPIPAATSITFAEVHTQSGVSAWEWVFKLDGTTVGASTLTSPTFTTGTSGLLRAEVRVTNSAGTSAWYGEDIGTVGAASGNALAETTTGATLIETTTGATLIEA